MKKFNGIAYYTSGSRKNQPVIFIHGFPYDHKMWNGQVKALSDKYFCVTYDIRGFGNSGVGDGQFTMELYADDLLALIQHLRLKNPAACGLSMGGYILLRAAEKDQSKFGGLIFCDTRADADNNEGRLKRSAGIKTINEKGLKKFTDSFVPGCFSDLSKKPKSEVYKYWLNKASKQNPKGVKGALIAMLSRRDTNSFLNEIKLTSLILCGEYDALTPPQIMKKMAGKISSGKFVQIPNAGHMSPLENPDAVNDEIYSFVEKLN